MRLDAVLDELEGLLPIRDRIIATNEQLVQAVHDAAIENERQFNERFMRGERDSLLRITDPDALDRAVATTAEQAPRDCLLVWLHGRFAVHEDGGQLVLEGTITDSATMLGHIRFPSSRSRGERSPQQLRLATRPGSDGPTRGARYRSAVRRRATPTDGRAGHDLHAQLTASPR